MASIAQEVASIVIQHMHEDCGATFVKIDQRHSFVKISRVLHRNQNGFAVVFGHRVPIFEEGKRRRNQPVEYQRVYCHTMSTAISITTNRLEPSNSLTVLVMRRETDDVIYKLDVNSSTTEEIAFAVSQALQLSEDIFAVDVLD
jgi:hypothetical protein